MAVNLLAFIYIQLLFLGAFSPKSKIKESINKNNKISRTYMTIVAWQTQSNLPASNHSGWLEMKETLGEL